MYSSCVDCDIGIFNRFRKPPYGGSNQFLLALKKELTRRNYLVRSNCISKSTKAAIVNAFVFDERLLRELRHNGCKIIHRVVGPVSVYRGTSYEAADKLQREANNEFADITVFQSRYSLEAHRRIGIEFRSPVVIMNGVDPDIFYPSNESRKMDKNKIRLIATSWSNHANKGRDTYKWLDENLDWTRFELSFVGRIQTEFKNIDVYPPVNSTKLANMLRQNDIFISAGLYETCSNALLEGLACNLPAVYANSGGNAEIVLEAGLGFNQKEEIPELLEQLVREYFERRELISIPSIKNVAKQYLDLVSSG